MATLTQNLITLSILTPLTLSAATELPEHWHSRMPEIILAALDKNEDQLISFSEALKHPRLSGRFLEIDTDGDGFIAPDELHTAKLSNPTLLHNLMSLAQLKSI